MQRTVIVAYPTGVISARCYA